MAWPEPDTKPSPKKTAENTNAKKEKPLEEQSPKEQPVVSNKPRRKDPMEGVTLLMVLERLEDKYGWDQLASRIRINCFAKDPSIKSSLKFLRRTPWARKKVEELYLSSDWD